MDVSERIAPKRILPDLSRPRPKVQIGPASKAPRVPNAREIADKARDERELQETAAFMGQLHALENTNKLHPDRHGIVKREPKSIYSPAGRSEFGSLPAKTPKARIMPDPAFGVEVKGSRVYQRGRFY